MLKISLLYLTVILFASCSFNNDPDINVITQGNNYLKGTINKPNGSRIDGATVVLYSDKTASLTKTLNTTISSNLKAIDSTESRNGEFEFLTVQEGIYTINAFYNDSLISTIENFSFTSDTNINLTTFSNSVGVSALNPHDSLEVSNTNTYGEFSSDTTLSKAFSPYTLTGDILITNGAKLTIEPGSKFYFIDNHKFHIKEGIISANGTADNVISFTQIDQSNNCIMMLFEDCNLSLSTISNIVMNDAYQAIRVGQESENDQSLIKNSGTLTISNIEINNTELRTDGYETTAKVILNNAQIYSSTIFGEFPNSEPIEINNSLLSYTQITSDSYNKGITINGSEIIESNVKIGCCSAMVNIDYSTITNSVIREGDGGLISITNSEVYNTDIRLPYIYYTFNNTLFTQGTKMEIGNGEFINSSFIGDSLSTGIIFTGWGDDNIVDSCLFQDLRTAINVLDFNTLTINNSNFINNDTNINNVSLKDFDATSNYWGSYDETIIQSKIFDNSDDTTKGKVDYSSYVLAPFVLSSQ